MPKPESHLFGLGIHLPKAFPPSLIASEKNKETITAAVRGSTIGLHLDLVVTL